MCSESQKRIVMQQVAALLQNIKRKPPSFDTTFQKQFRIPSNAELEARTNMITQMLAALAGARPCRRQLQAHAARTAQAGGGWGNNVPRCWRDLGPMFLVVLGSKNHRFPFKFLFKSIDFESRAGSGAAGDRKTIDFLLNSF